RAAGEQRSAVHAWEAVHLTIQDSVLSLPSQSIRRLASVRVLHRSAGGHRLQHFSRSRRSEQFLSLCTGDTTEDRDGPRSAVSSSLAASRLPSCRSRSA